MKQTNKPTFIEWIIAYDGPFTYCCEIRNWIILDPKWSHIKSRSWLEAQMRQYSYFKKRHFRKVEVAYEMYCEEMS